MKILQMCFCLFILLSITSSVPLHVSYATGNQEILLSAPIGKDGISTPYEVRGSVVKTDSIPLISSEKNTYSDKDLEISIPEVITEGIPFFITVKTKKPASIRIIWNKKDIPFSQSRKEKEYIVDTMLVLPITKYKPSVHVVVTVDGVVYNYQLRAIKSAYTLVKRSGPKNIPLKDVRNNPAITKALLQRDRLFRTVSPERYWEKGIWGKPVMESSIISKRFGETNIYNGKRQPPHQAVDFSGKVGDPIYASSAGRVVFVSPFYFLGKTIYINHGQGIFSGYSSLDTYEVAVGDIVKAGQKIATMGQVTPKHKPKLHFGLFSLGEHINPTELFNKE